MTHHYTILHGGIVLTFDEARPSDAASRAAAAEADAAATVPDAAGRRATAVCLADGVILAIGGDAEVLALGGADSTFVHLRGRAVVAGFVDPHAHPYGEGLMAARPSLEGAADLRTAMRRLPGAGEHLDPDAWVVARYNHVRWPEGRHPTRDDLDRAIPDRPVVLSHASGHAAVANSLALALSGITAATPDRPGEAVLIRDASGEPTGVVEGTEAWTLLATGMPPAGDVERDLAMRTAAARLAADGVTWASDADLGSVTGLEFELAAYGDALARGSFPLGISLMPGLTRLAPRPEDDPPAPSAILAALPESVRDRVRVLHVKLKADGALTTRTAWLASPYEDAAETLGRRVHAPGVLAERVRRAERAGWGVATHAIGDAAVAGVLDAYEAATTDDGAVATGEDAAPGANAAAEDAATGANAAGEDAAPGANAAAEDAATGDARSNAETAPRAHAANRIEHGMILPPALMSRLASTRFRIVAQPEFTAWAGDVYLRRLGDERASRILPYAELLAAGVPLAFSSDRPVVGGAPLDGIRAALRHDPGISVAECLYAWTVEAAAAAGVDDAGRLAVGCRADLVILSGDPTAVPRDAWARGEDGVRVEATIAGGRLVFGMLEGLDARAGERIDVTPPARGRKARR